MTILTSITFLSLLTCITKEENWAVTIILANALSQFISQQDILDEYEEWFYPTGEINDNNNGLLKYTRWHKNYELQCAYMIQEIKLHLFRRDWDYRLFISYLQFGYG